MNDEGCSEAREKTFVGPALYNKKEVQEDLVNLKQVQVDCSLFSEILCLPFMNSQILPTEWDKYL